MKEELNPSPLDSSKDQGLTLRARVGRVAYNIFRPQIPAEYLETDEGYRTLMLGSFVGVLGAGVFAVINLAANLTILDGRAVEAAAFIPNHLREVVAGGAVSGALLMSYPLIFHRPILPLDEG